MYFAQSGKLEDLLDWFYSSPPALFESSSYRTHPLLLCLLVPGGPKSKRLLEDVIANRESLNLRLGPDVALFIFGHSNVECAVPAYRPFDFQHGPNHTVDASGGLGVWKSFPEAVFPRGGLLAWTIDRVPGEDLGLRGREIEHGTTAFAEQVIRRFNLCVDDMPSMVVLYADPNVPPWVLSMEEDSDASRIFSLIKRVRSIGEKMTTGLFGRIQAIDSRVTRVLSYPNAVGKLRDDLDAAQTASDAYARQLEAALRAVCDKLRTLGLPDAALAFLCEPHRAHRVFALLGYRSGVAPPSPLNESDEILAAFRTNTDNRALIREVAKGANVWQAASKAANTARAAIESKIRDYEQAVSEVLQMRELSAELAEAKRLFLSEVGGLVRDAEAVSKGPVDAGPIEAIVKPLSHLSKVDATLRRLDGAQQMAKRPILLVAATDVEILALLAAFGSGAGQAATRKPIGDKDYFDVGMHGGNHVLLTRTEMGSIAPGASAHAVSQAILAVNPAAVILAGIAFGARESSQSLGDVLISKQLLLYDPQKVVNGRVLFRGDKVPASVWLLEKLRNSTHGWNEAKVHVGPMLTGEKLIDDRDILEGLVDAEPEAIGGEMEGAGLYSACHPRTDWIIVKAICDWAYHKPEQKEERQLMAAKCCASFLAHVLKTSTLVRLDVS